MIKRFLIFIIFAFQVFSLKAQDPHFTQFYSAPLSVNPAYTGVFDGRLRAVSNFRKQWSGLSSDYTTTSISVDGKLGKQGKENVTQNAFNWGVQFMNDRSMKGAFRSNFFTGTGSYHKVLDREGYKSLGIGFNVTYGSRRIDFSSTSFESQFTSGGFDLTIPNSESALSNMKPYLSLGTGLLYIYNNIDDGIFFDIGASIYHVNRPKQTFLNDNNQYVPVRYSAQISYQKYLNEDLYINLRALYQNQATVNYLLGGVSLAKLLGSNYNLIGAGVWYRTSDAVSPYVFFEFSDIQIGLSYDATISNLKSGPTPLRSFEFSIMWRQPNRK